MKLIRLITHAYAPELNTAQPGLGDRCREVGSTLEFSNQQGDFMKLGIDCNTNGHKKLVARLAALKTTADVHYAGPYRQNVNICQIHIETTWSEAELDEWLYKAKGIDYIGTFVLKPEAPEVTGA